MRGPDIAALPPHELLDDGYAPESCDLLVIGCGNILRGDDAVGPVLIRHLYERGAPPGVRLVDGGTAGMDVAFGMRGAARVVIVDASATGAEPGTVYRVPAEELTELPPLDGLHTHNFRWDHALSFSAWLLGPDRPTDVLVYLIEVASCEPGDPLSPAVETALHRVLAMVEGEYPGSGEDLEITADGYLHVPAALAAERFPAGVLLARREDEVLVLVPLASAGHGGLVLKQRNSAGDRSVLLSEALGFAPVHGRFIGTWDADRGALTVPLGGGGDDARGAHGGDPRGGPVGGLPDGADPRGCRPDAGGAPLHRGQGETGRRRDQADGGSPPAPAGGDR